MRLGWKVLIPLAIANLVVTGIVKVLLLAVMVEAIAFYTLAAFILGFARAGRHARNTVHSVLFLVLDFLFVAALYVLLGAEFLAVIQVLVYAGGIVVLYLFVVMLVNLKRPPEAHRIRSGARRWVRRWRRRCWSEFAAIAGLSRVRPARAGGRGGAAMPVTGNTEQVGWLLYTGYLIPFEIASMLLLVAMVGAIVLAQEGDLSSMTADHAHTTTCAVRGAVHRSA